MNGIILRSKSLSFEHGQRKTVLLKIEKIGPNFFPDFLIPRALLALDVQEGWNETQIKNYKSDTEITRNRQTCLEWRWDKSKVERKNVSNVLKKIN